MAAGLADRVEVQVAYVIGVARPLSLLVETSGPSVRSASGYQLFNLSPVMVVPAASLIVWWIPLAPVACALGGLSASSGYLLAVASLFQAIRRVPR